MTGVQDGCQDKILQQRVVKQWNRLSREVVVALSLLKFKKHLDNAFRHMVLFLGGLCGARNWT